MKFTKLLFFCILFITSAGAFAQGNITVSGNIVDDTGLPIPGTTVSEKGTKNAVSSDFDGNYKITVDSQATLVFSFLGYRTKQEPVNGRNLINIQFYPDTQNLDEVIVVGYGTQRKSVNTGAISSIKAKDLENLPITRVEQALQGRTSGVMIMQNSGQPGSASTIRIRGLTSFLGTNPLWVVDGIIIDAGGIGFLNQSDIESIEVLKDAASQAIYGTRAAAGVILITTKKGKEGKLSVNYNGFTGTSSPARKLDLLNATQYATLRNESYVNGYTSGNFQLPFADPNSLGEGTDWQSQIFNKSAQRSSHELSLSGGNEKSTFYASFGLLDQEGIVSTDISHYIRRNFRLNSNHKVAPWLTIGQTVGYSNEKTMGIGNTNNEYGGPLISAINLDPTTPAVEYDPVLAAAYPQGAIRDENGNPYGISPYVQQEITNPLAYARTKTGNYGWADNFVGNVFAEVEPIKGLKFRTTLGGKLAFWGSESYTPASYLNSNTITLENNISRNTNRGFGWNVENTVSYTRSIKDHNFTVLLGQGAYIDNIAKGMTTTYNNIPANSYADAAFPGSHPPEDIVASATTGVEHRVTSIFGRLNYDYKERYLVTGIIRRDGSSRFGANNKYGVFPSFSLGWVISKEAFWKENDIVNSVKIRGGYGTVGSDSFGDFAFLSTVGGGRNYGYGNTGSYVVGYSPNAPSNPDLQWEETSQTNIGFDMRFLKNFNMTFDWYKKETNNLLRQKPIPGYIGAVAPPYANVGRMNNKGLELELGYDKRFGEFGFKLSGNVTYLENEVIALDEATKFIDGERFQGLENITRIEPGHAYGEFYGYQTNGIFQNQAEVDAYVNADGTAIQPNAQPGDFRFADNNGDGKISADDRAFIGDPTPDWVYGFTLNLDYKGVDLLVFGQGVAGNQIFQGLRRLDIPTANYQTDALNRWTGEGTTNSYPRLADGDPNGNFSKFSSFYLQDGDYFRIKTIQLGYTLPKKVTQKAFIQNLRLYLTGENLFTFTKYTGYDPEVGGGTLGIDRGQYPQAKSYMFGVNLQF